jgi:hypothetical protein
MKKVLTPLFILLTLSVVVLYAKISTDYEHSANFLNYHTYSWLKVKATDQLWEDRTKRDIDAQLTEKGWQQVASGGDASVSAFASTREQPQINTFYDGFGGGWGWRGFRGGGGLGGTGFSTTSVDNIAIGTLVVDIFDSHTKMLIWRTVATDTLSGNPEKDEKKLANTVQDMFKHFPPKPKG